MTEKKRDLWLTVVAKNLDNDNVDCYDVTGTCSR